MPILRVDHVTLERILPGVWKIVSSGVSMVKRCNGAKVYLHSDIAEAERAVVLRARELFQVAGDNGEETEALDDVMYALHALRSNHQNLGVS